MDGIVPLWKPKGITSASCVHKVRKILGLQKVGHTGTLDPDVEGVLPICVGAGTKLVEYLVDSPKVYEVVMRFGYATTTEDASGELVASKAVKANDITLPALQKVLDQFTGEIEQVPPMYSAVKVNGRRLYKYAHSGKTIERQARTVTIYNFECLSDIVMEAEKTASVAVKVTCSKGTYMRTLTVDIGKALGFPAHMASLKRISSAGITKEQTVTFSELESAVEAGRYQEVLLPLAEVFTTFPQVEVNEDMYRRIQNGAILEKNNFPADLSYPVSFIYHGDLIAIYKNYEKNPELIKTQKTIKVRS